jgi:LPS export ABC transporter protein LptC
MKVALLLLCAIALVGCDDTERVQPVNVGNSLDRPAQITHNTTMTFSTEGVIKAVLHAKRVRTYEDQKFTYLDSGVRVEFYDRLGQHSTTLTSGRGAVNLGTNDMTAYDSVHIVSDSGTVVDTDSLQWLNRSQQLHSDAHVRIAEKNGRITTGMGFDGDQNLTHYQILRPTIEAPASSWSNSNPTNSVKPEQPEVPGSHAFTPQPGFKLKLADSSRKADSVRK